MKKRTFDQITIGENASITQVITDEMVRGYAELTGDKNPVHIDEEYASKTIFKERIAHGILVTGLISNVLGTQLPGEGAIYMSQQVSFLRPVKIGDEITATITAVEKDEKRRSVRFSTNCTNQHGKVVIKGEAVGLPPKE